MATALGIVSYLSAFCMLYALNWAKWYVDMLVDLTEMIMVVIFDGWGRSMYEKLDDSR